MYEKFFKRAMDILLSFIAISVLSPIIIVLAVLVAIFMKGNPFFVQVRPTKKDKNGREKLFYMIKFRTMTNERDENGDLLPDEQRLNSFGKVLRSTSLDELPELFNIFIGNMSIVGPRPQLVRDMVFMTEEQRRRHTVRAGLTGLAQVSGRNNITWEKKLEYDIEYVESITFGGDVKLIFKTVKKVFKREDTVREGTVSDMDFGDWLLQNGAIDKATYDAKQLEAKKLLKNK